MLATITKLLDDLKWRLNYDRPNVSDHGCRSVNMGLCHPRFKKGIHLTALSQREPILHRHLCQLIKEHDPIFKWTTITINKNLQTKPHTDSHNVGKSWIIGLGDYQGGELVIDGVEHDIKEKWLQFDGTIEHYTKPFIGTRYSLVFFTDGRVIRSKWAKLNPLPSLD